MVFKKYKDKNEYKSFFAGVLLSCFVKDVFTFAKNKTFKFALRIFNNN
jgi:hypothetical protein